jgi:hypothetical protein
MRQKSIYPGQTDEYPRGGGGIGPGVPLDRQDSDTFSWSSLFSMTSVDGYGLNGSSSSDRNYAAQGSLGASSPSMKTKIKVELNQDEKHMKRGIAELGSLSGDPNYSSIDKNSENRENSFRRQRISSSYPPLNPHSSGPGTPLPSLATQGTIGNMDPPSLDKPDASEVFYGRHNEVRFQNTSYESDGNIPNIPLTASDSLNRPHLRPQSNSLTRNDSLELTIATLLKSMDSFDANNNNNNNNNAAT